MKISLILLAIFMCSFSSNVFAQNPILDEFTGPCPEVDGGGHFVTPGHAIIGDESSGCYIRIDYCAYHDIIMGVPGDPDENDNWIFWIYIHAVYYVGDCSHLPTGTNGNGGTFLQIPSMETIITAVGNQYNETFYAPSCDPQNPQYGTCKTVAKVASGGCFMYQSMGQMIDRNGNMVNVGGWTNCNPGAIEYCRGDMCICINEQGEVVIISEDPYYELPVCTGGCQSQCDIQE
jgi:hypothetical protein